MILDSVDVKLGPGESVGLSGPIDSGKLTLLRMIARFEPRGFGRDPGGRPTRFPGHDSRIPASGRLLEPEPCELLAAADPPRAVGDQVMTMFMIAVAISVGVLIAPGLCFRQVKTVDHPLR